MSLVWTPLVTAGLLAVVMLFSVVVADRFSANGQPILDMLMQENLAHGMTITIHVDDDSGADTDTDTEYQVERAEGDAATEEWDFSRDWEFKPKSRDRGEFESEGAAGTLNPILNVIHMVMLLVLFVVVCVFVLSKIRAY